MPALTVAIFVLTYLGMAAGRVPGVRLDRSGIAIVAGALLVALVPGLSGRLGGAIDFPTLLVLGSLMLVSAQLEESHFYELAAFRLARIRVSPVALLGLVVLAVGALAALLTNDVVVFALTPLLIAGLRARRLDPRPYLLAAAAASNAVSAATILGNPQNVLISQVGHLSFGAFFTLAAPPALLGLAVSWAVIALAWRGQFSLPAEATLPPATAEASVSPLGEQKNRDSAPENAPFLDRAGTIKGLVALVLVVGLLFVPGRGLAGMVAVAGLLLVSRRRSPRELLARIDWPMLLLFVGLFVVTDALAATGLPARAFASLLAAGIDPARLAALLPVALLGSNTIGNVPLTALLLSVWKSPTPGSLVALSVLATLAGNLFTVGSIANLIVLERAAREGIRLRFIDHARTGVPITLISMAIAAGWLWAAGAAGW